MLSWPLSGWRLSRRSRPVRTIRRGDPSWLVLFSISLSTFALHPYRWWARFTFVLAAVAAVAAAAVMSPPFARGPRDAWTSRLPPCVPVGVAVIVLAVQPALLAHAIVSTDGSAPVAAWRVLTVSPGIV